jgi:hypothetical protein
VGQRVPAVLDALQAFREDQTQSVLQHRNPRK